MKLKYTFETIEIDGEIMAVPVGDGSEDLHCMFKLNEVAAKVMELLKEETTLDAMTDELLKIYEADRETVKSGISDFVKTLDDAGVLV